MIRCSAGRIKSAAEKATDTDETNFSNNSFLTDRQVVSLFKSFADKSSRYTELTRTHIAIIIQSDKFLGRPLEPLIKVGLSLMRNTLTPLAKSVLLPLGLTATASIPEAGIHQKIL